MNILRITIIALLAQAATSPQVAHVEGIVIKMGSGEPLAGANVQLHSGKEPADPFGDGLPDARVLSATSGTDGKFAFDNVAPGIYRLFATRSGGYVPGEYGQRSPTGEGIPLDVTAGQRLAGIQLALSPTGSISGHVYDRDGEPLGGAQVQALRPVYRDGRKTLTIVQSVISDDRGEYRLFWLAPGRYYVSAQKDAAELPVDLGLPNSSKAAIVHITDPARFGTYEQASEPVIHKRTLRTGEVVEETYLPVFYPGVTDTAAASQITIGAGGGTTGIDITAGAGLVRTWHIRGRVINAEDGQPAAATNISAVPRVSGPSLTIPAAHTDENGFFDIAGVRPGSYTLFVTSRHTNAMASVEVGEADVQNVTIAGVADFKLSGKLIIEGRLNLAKPTVVNETLISPDGGTAAVWRLIRDPEIPGAQPGPRIVIPLSSGSFELGRIAPGHYRVEVALPSEGYVKSMRVGNVDVLDAGLQLDRAPDNPLEIVIGTNAGRIEGSVLNSRQEPLPNRTVVLIPDASHRQRNDLYKDASTDSSGRFQILDIPPGDYELFAWESIDPGAWQDPEYLQNYEGRGKRIHIAEGSRESVSLTVIP